ncbi:MAG: hypothetical protein AB7K52_07580 [Phycisphaerales bacterium]
MTRPRLRCLALAVTAFCGAAGPLCAQPVEDPWAVTGPDRPFAVAAAALAGVHAVADVEQDRVEVRDTRGTLIRALTRADFAALFPWMSLDESDDGPVAIALSDSGRLVFIGVRDTNTAPDGQPNDGIVRCEIDTGEMQLFARLDLGAATTAARPALAHFRGRLHVGTPFDTRVYNAQANVIAGSLVTTTPTPASSLAVDRDVGMLYAIDAGAGPGGSTLRRAPTGQATLTYSTVALSPAITTMRSLAWSDHFGNNQSGLFILAAGSGGAGPSLWRYPAANIRALTGGPAQYISDTVQALGAPIDLLASTADGRLFAAPGPTGDALTIRDASDTRLAFDAWAADEFAQHVRFAKGLISPDGEPPGWVIDADVQLGWTRFHPATADGACWVILTLLMNDELNADPQAQPLVRTILQRYAGRAPDGIRPLRSADGIYWHWLDPFTGNAKAGWGDSYATLSTMKIVLAAARAVQRWPSDAEIRASAHDIICGISNWDPYISAAGNRPLAFLGLAGGNPQANSFSNPFHEGIIFVEQAAAYGGASSQSAFDHWLNRANLPIAVSLTAKPVTTGAFGAFQPAFVSLYSLLAQSSVRARPDWQSHYQNLRLSNAAWTDDNGPRYNTVFSAGTTRSDWGGYHADSLSNHPGDVTTFPSLLAQVAGNGSIASAPHVPSAVAGYQAYRRGARQTFLSGASILYRRSQIDLAYQPNSAGLPDVSLGALGLAELLSPGSVARVLAGAYPTCEALATPPCPADFNQDGNVDPDDLGDFINCFFAVPSCPGADFNQDGNIDPDDLGDYINTFFGPGC